MNALIISLYCSENNINCTADNTTMNSYTFIIPTKRSEPAKEKEIDTQKLTEDDLKSLKKKDPFLYYSIPAVRSAALLNKDVAMSSLQGRKSQCSRSGRASCPSQIESIPTTKVVRRSCISFECHPDLILEDYLDNTADDEYDLDLDSMIRQLQVMRSREAAVQESSLTR